MIVIAGGTGRLGLRVASRLGAAGHDVRILGRAKDGDLRDITVGKVRGASVVVSCVTGFPDQPSALVDRDGNRALVRVCEAVGADLVLVSVDGAAEDSPMELFRMKYAAEQAVRAASTPWTIVRPDAFRETWVEILEQTAGRRGRPVVLGRGDNPFAWVSVDDVAGEVAAAALDPRTRGQVLTVRGPERYCVEELARRVMAEHGWTGQPRHLPRGLLHVARLIPGKPGRLAAAGLAMDELPPPY